MRNILFILLLFLNLQGQTQNLSGTWAGRLFQDNKDQSFLYELHIDQEGDIINGTSYSLNEESGASARFALTGAWDGDQLILQEIKQTEPASPKWCLKYITFSLKNTGSQLQLEGRWKADGCTPGRIELKSESHEVETITEVAVPDFSMAGEWMGFLYQEDRNYGFYYEFDLEPDQTGTSYIVSEDNGGSANIDLSWSYDKDNQQLILREQEVAEKTDDKWPWCIKRAKLKLTQGADRYTLEGDWKGFIEGFTQKTGACAPGKMVMERLIPSPQVTLAIRNYQPYETNKERKVKVERTLEVQNSKLLIKVWDNGTVDGDIVTLFLNGEQLLEKYRVSKRKYGMNVKLNEDTNFLILHAEDLGAISPNTVAVSVDDGIKEQIIILSSNLRESGAVMIKQFKVN